MSKDEDRRPIEELEAALKQVQDLIDSVLGGSDEEMD
jgi:hypothetical protein